MQKSASSSLLETFCWKFVLKVRVTFLIRKEQQMTTALKKNVHLYMGSSMQGVLLVFFLLLLIIKAKEIDILVPIL